MPPDPGWHAGRAIQPAGQPGKTQKVWTSGSLFDELGWAPDGSVRGSYGMNAQYTQAMCQNPAGGTTVGMISGRSDVDNDNNYYCLLNILTITDEDAPVITTIFGGTFY